MRVVREVAPHRRERRLEVGADAVHLVREGDARDAPAVRLAPHRLALRLDPVHRVEHRHRAVEDAQAPLDLDGEVHVAGGVDEVQLVAAPVEARDRRGDGDAALALEVHPVHHRGALVDLAHLVGAARREEEALGERRLPGVDVGHDAEVADRPDPPPLRRLLPLRRSSVAPPESAADAGNHRSRRVSTPPRAGKFLDAVTGRVMDRAERAVAPGPISLLEGEHELPLAARRRARRAPRPARRAPRRRGGPRAARRRPPPLRPRRPRTRSRSAASSATRRATLDGVALRVDGELPFQELSPQVKLSLVGSIGYIVRRTTTRFGGDITANLLKIVPAARFSFPVNPQLTLFGDAGLGLY